VLRLVGAPWKRCVSAPMRRCNRLAQRLQRNQVALSVAVVWVRS